MTDVVGKWTIEMKCNPFVFQNPKMLFYFNVQMKKKVLDTVCTLKAVLFSVNHHVKWIC